MGTATWRHHPMDNPHMLLPLPITIIRWSHLIHYNKSMDNRLDIMEVEMTVATLFLMTPPTPHLKEYIIPLQLQLPRREGLGVGLLMEQVKGILAAMDSRLILCWRN